MLHRAKKFYKKLENQFYTILRLEKTITLIKVYKILFIELLGDWYPNGVFNFMFIFEIYIYGQNLTRGNMVIICRKNKTISNNNNFIQHNTKFKHQ